MVGESVGRQLRERKGARWRECALRIECRAQWRRGRAAEAGEAAVRQAMVEKGAAGGRRRS
jgi:hypothetical protein